MFFQKEIFLTRDNILYLGSQIIDQSCHQPSPARHPNLLSNFWQGLHAWSYDPVINKMCYQAIYIDNCFYSLTLSNKMKKWQNPHSLPLQYRAKSQGEEVLHNHWLAPDEEMKIVNLSLSFFTSFLIFML